MRNLLRYSVTLFVLTAITIAVDAQDLETLIRQSESPVTTEKHDALISLAHYYSRQNASLKAYDYWNEALDLEKENYGKTNNETEYGAAEALYNSEQYQPAIIAYQKLLTRFKGNDDSVTQYPAWAHLISSYEHTDQPDNALNEYSILITRFAMRKNHVAYVSLLNHMGIIEKGRKNLSYAFDYFTNARRVVMQYSREIPAELKREIYANLAVTHAERSEFITSLSYFANAENQVPATAVSTAHLLNLKGATYLLMGRYEDAQKSALGAISMMKKGGSSLEDQQILADSYDLLARLYKERDWPTYQQYHGEYLAQKDRISQIQQMRDQEKLLQSIEIEKKESELRSDIANKERVANEARQQALESESAKRSLELKVRELEVLKQNEDLSRFQLEKQLLIRKQAEQGLLLEKQRLETENQQKELDRQELVQQRKEQELELVKSQNLLYDNELDVTKQQTRFAIYFAILGGVVFLLLLIGVITLYRSRRKLIQGNELIRRQKQEIEKQNEEINKTVIRLESAQMTIESQNKKLTSYNETLEQQVADRTEQLLESNGELRQNNHQLEQYSYMTAHNLRGPIARLLGLTSIFHKLPTDSHGEIVDKVQKEASSLDTLIKDLNQILQVRKATEELSQEINIEKAFVQSIKILDAEIEESGVEIKTDFSAAPCVIFVPTYFENILYNLVSNAIKYRHAERPLLLVISSDDEPDYVRLQISDNGLGIDLEKNKQNIFGLYKRFHFHKDGKGIGLYLIKAQIETMGGSIEIESKVGMGTKFTLMFPKESMIKTKITKARLKEEQTRVVEVK